MTRRGLGILGVAAGLSVACAGKLNVHGDELAGAGGSEGGSSEQVADGTGGRDDSSGQGGSREQTGSAGAGKARAVPDTPAEGGAAGTRARAVPATPAEGGAAGTRARAVPETPAEGGTAGIEASAAGPPGGTSSSAGGASGAGGAEWNPRECNDRPIADCEADARCRLHRLRPLNVDDECLEAPASAECVAILVACPDGPRTCLRDANDRTWFGTECGRSALTRARTGDPCLFGQQGVAGARGVDLTDCPGATEKLERECSAMATEARRLLDEAMPFVPRSCETDDDCTYHGYGFRCIEYCFSSRRLDEDDETLDRLMQPVGQACRDYDMLGCEPGPECWGRDASWGCIDGLCTITEQQ